MTYKTCAAYVAIVSAAVIVVTSEGAARSGAGPHGWLGAKAFSHGFVARSIFHHRRGNLGDVWPAGGYFDGPNDQAGAPVPAALPVPGNMHITTVNEVPWDWVHRYPPLVAPSDRPYVASCTTETTTFPGHDSEVQTVNVTRCY